MKINQEIHKKLLELMKDIHSVSQKNKLTYSLEAGSALGAIREKGFIPGDDDIDILIPFKEYDIFVATMRRELKGKVVDGLKDAGNELMFTRIYYSKEIYIDVVPFTFTKANGSKYLKLITELKGYRKLNLNHLKGFEKFGFAIVKGLLHIFPDFILRKLIKAKMTKIDKKSGDNFYPFGNVGVGKKRDRVLKGKLNKVFETKFEDTKFYIGENYDELLKGHYGEDYMTPKQTGGKGWE